MSRPVRYRCPAHGMFRAEIRCGFGAGPAPESIACPQCAAPSIRDHSGGSNTIRSLSGRRRILVSAQTAIRLHAYCEAHGLTADAVIDALIPDARARP